MNLIDYHYYYSDKLNRQHGTHRDASYELRSVCFTAIQMALETKRMKFIHIALNGMHVSHFRIVRCCGAHKLLI